MGSGRVSCVAFRRRAEKELLRGGGGVVSMTTSESESGEWERVLSCACENVMTTGSEGDPVTEATFNYDPTL